MIARLQGRLLEKSPPLIVIDCNGVGYEVEVPMSTFYNLPELGQPVQILTHMVVREDAQLLYGFGSEQEKNTFKQLLKVNGIGAKSALSILSGVSVNDLMLAVSQQEVSMLTRIPGIGKKTAERLLLELKDKFVVTGSTSAQPSAKAATDDILNALVALGYNEREASATVKLLEPGISVSDGIRQALKYLAK
ncbi:MAG: Holliday junction branch migration protein RuvA [Methylotenera sp.]|jgi:holliday junction DNA helicase RuvA|uniref:Holliday junction branch migration protein RuvA n=1 Tax=Methylophilaceae TaxID=32011 RepID=UPI000D3FC228|nr:MULTISPECIES: Holliday junction branch migration protein RuvA [Methylophilaceae]PPC83174.1 MAG: Holliday junction branch migration protein RuvA [Methylotenera sp.]TXI43361.1 MAG: Holliday junction branch migration protein RuvA [Methylophilus sp.]